MDLTKPRGKQDWQLEPHSIWYPRTTGIWQTVWFERVARTYIGKIRWTPHGRGLRLDFEARIAGDRCRRPSVEVQLRHGQRLLARDSYRVARQRDRPEDYLVGPRHRRLPQRNAMEPGAAHIARCRRFG